MARSQETFNKKQREKERARKKKAKRDKRDLRRDSSESGLQIDWSSAPENNTLTEAEREQQQKNQQSNNQ